MKRDGGFDKAVQDGEENQRDCQGAKQLYGEHPDLAEMIRGDIEDDRIGSEDHPRERAERDGDNDTNPQRRAKKQRDARGRGTIGDAVGHDYCPTLTLTVVGKVNSPGNSISTL